MTWLSTPVQFNWGGLFPPLNNGRIIGAVSFCRRRGQRRCPTRTQVQSHVALRALRANGCYTFSVTCRRTLKFWGRVMEWISRGRTSSRMVAKQCHKPTMTGNGNHTTYKKCEIGDGLLLFYLSINGFWLGTSSANGFLTRKSSMKGTYSIVTIPSRT